MTAPANAASRTISLPGVDMTPRTGPTFTVTISFPHGMYPALAAADLAALLEGPLARTLERLGLTAKVST